MQPPRPLYQSPSERPEASCGPCVKAGRLSGRLELQAPYKKTRGRNKTDGCPWCSVGASFATGCSGASGCCLLRVWNGCCLSIFPLCKWLCGLQLLFRLWARVTDSVVVSLIGTLRVGGLARVCGRFAARCRCGAPFSLGVAQQNIQARVSFNASSWLAPNTQLVALGKS